MEIYEHHFCLWRSFSFFNQLFRWASVAGTSSENHIQRVKINTCPIAIMAIILTLEFCFGLHI